MQRRLDEFPLKKEKIRKPPFSPFTDAGSPYPVLYDADEFFLTMRYFLECDYKGACKVGPYHMTHGKILLRAESFLYLLRDLFAELEGKACPEIGFSSLPNARYMMKIVYPPDLISEERLLALFDRSFLTSVELSKTSYGISFSFRVQEMLAYKIYASGRISLYNEFHRVFYSSVAPVCDPEQILRHYARRSEEAPLGKDPGDR